MSPAAAPSGRWTHAGLDRRATQGNCFSMSAARILSRCARSYLLVVCLLAALPAHAQDLPARVGKVNDFAEVLEASDREDLERQLAALERDTSAEIAVVTMHTLRGRTAEDYAHELFAAWHIGKSTSRLRRTDAGGGAGSRLVD